MDVTVSEDLDVAFVLLTPNFDSALLLYLLCEKIAAQNLKVQIHVGVCVLAEEEKQFLDVVRQIAYHISSIFPNIINSHIRGVRYYIPVDHWHNKLSAHTIACKEWAITFSNEFADNINIACYVADSSPLDENNLVEMENLYVKDFTKMRLMGTRARTTVVSSESRNIQVFRPFVDNNVSRKEVYSKLKQLDLLYLYDKTFSCTLPPKYEHVHKYSEPCGECYGCLEREYIKSL